MAKNRAITKNPTEGEGKLKICVACSAGGHQVQVRQLAAVYEPHDYFYFTFEGGVADALKQRARVRTIPNILRSNPWSWIRGAVLSFSICAREKPDLIITTGAGVVVFLCIFAKLFFGSRLIFLESMAKIEKPTMTARILYPFSDLFIVQWPGLKKYFARALYCGRLF